MSEKSGNGGNIKIFSSCNLVSRAEIFRRWALGTSVHDKG